MSVVSSGATNRRGTASPVSTAPKAARLRIKRISRSRMAAQHLTLGRHLTQVNQLMALMVHIICMKAGCGKPTWNGQPGEYCSKACRQDTKP